MGIEQESLGLEQLNYYAEANGDQPPEVVSYPCCRNITTFCHAKVRNVYNKEGYQGNDDHYQA